MGNSKTFPSLAFSVVLSIAVLLSSGCASGPGQRSETTSAESPAQKQAPQAAVAAPAVAPAAAAAKEDEPPPAPLPPGFDKPTAPFEGTGWQDMFDGETLQGWKETLFAGHGNVSCRKGAMFFSMGDPFTGANYTNAFPTMNYEIALDAMRVMGSDFFCGLTIPVGETHCSLIVGGWGGSLVGISSLDGMDASENETTKFMTFESGRWYRVRMRVTNARIEGWIDDERIINVNTTDRRIALRPGDIEMSKPIGIACWQTTSAVREVKYRKVDAPAGPPRKGF